MPVILVVGSTGGVGREIVRELLNCSGARTALNGRGNGQHSQWQIRALVRDAGAVNSDLLWGRLGGGVEVVQGNVTRPDSLEAAVRGAGIVIMAHSRRRGEAGASAQAVDYAGTCAVCQAAAAAAVSKLVYVSSNSVDCPDRTSVKLLNWIGVRSAGRPLFLKMSEEVLPGKLGALTRRLVLTQGMGMAWKLRAEAAVRNSGISYVIVRPVGLKNERGCCSAAVQQQEFGLGRVSRTAVGSLCVRVLTEAPSNCTVNVGAADKQWQDITSALAELLPDDSARAGRSATFAQHEAATQAFAGRVRLLAVGLVGLGLGLTAAAAVAIHSH
jgi:uncharacterized protein YbjT (DUF2867 family)